jgi:type VI secretion system secreted protein Hcp
MAIFMKFGSLNGEVTAAGYEKWIELESCSFSASRNMSAGPGGASKREGATPNVSEIGFSKTIDSATPLLLKELIGGQAKDVKIDWTQTDNNGKHIAYQKFILTNSILTNHSLQAHSEGRPHESLSINFTKLDSEYIKIDDKFKTETTGHVIYDLEKAQSK